MKSLKYIIAILIASVFMGCDDTFEDDFVKDSIPAIPVTYLGATTYGFNPYYLVADDGTVTITLQIPEDSPLQIRELTKAVVGGSGINAGTLKTGVNYLPEPIAVNGTSVSFTTSLADFNAKVPAAAQIPTAVKEGAFMFLLTMEDGSEIIPTQLRIRVQ